MDTRSPLFVWIGAVGGLIGFWVFNAAPLDDLLPLNQTLFAALCGLMVIWLMVSLVRGWRTGHDNDA